MLSIGFAVVFGTRLGFGAVGRSGGEAVRPSVLGSTDQPLTRAQARQLARRLRHITLWETQRGRELRSGGRATTPTRGRPVPGWHQASLRRLRRMLGIWWAAAAREGSSDRSEE